MSKVIIILLAVQYGGYNKDVKEFSFWDYAAMTQQETIANGQDLSDNLFLNSYKSCIFKM